MLFEDRYARQNMLPLYASGSELIKNTRIGVIGAGGLGGLFSLLLALSGVGFIRLADYDTVASHNLHRQILFKESDIGSYKVLSAAKEIEKHNSECDVDAFKLKVDENSFASFASGLDLIADLSDSASSRNLVSSLCLQSGIDLFSGAVSGFTALFALFAYKEPSFVSRHGCYYCLTQGAEICTKVGITGPAASCAASLAAHLCLSYILKDPAFKPGVLIRSDLNSLSLHKMSLKADPLCPHCAAKYLT